MKMTKKIFDQFTPVYMGFFSLTSIGALLAVIWMFAKKSSHLLPNRSKIVSTVSLLVQEKILPKTFKPWKSFIVPMFLLCLSYKILSLIPYTFSQTSHLSFTFSLSIPVWLTLKMMGLIKKWKSKLAHLVPQGTPPALIPLMIIMEIVSLCIQPLTLGFRLGANILAGHLLIFLCSCVVWTAMSSSNLGVLSFILLFLLFILEMAVAFMQSAVFTMLTNQYFNENKS